MRQNKGSVERPQVRQIISIAALLTGSILLLVIGAVLFQEKRYAWISFGIAVLACAVMFGSFDRRHTHIRRIVFVSVMTALSVGGRFLFAVLPAFKPMTAVIVMTGVYFGAEAGFLCGAFTAVLSNFYFGQGPWTPFQMVSFGLIGLLAGVLHRPLKTSRAALVIYGIFAGAFYSLIMDVWTVLWSQASFEPAMYAAAVLSAAPFTLLYSISNVIFLLLMRRPLGARLQRVITKYGV
ncbi:MAG: ECF transporter S component [Clostridium sp.]|nr:ECF transporter S component [Clostridium sp.]